ncbi:EAL domain-containing protein [Thiorhodospira sibirica]|uniref:EAL domain-containing protein n=1 Tax=Thiorhodospira sibirica TaxID=154347 RepID=UPI00022C4669|nr:EAL domain-containing protein [Thiorhodospira sibirica]
MDEVSLRTPGKFTKDVVLLLVVLLFAWGAVADYLDRYRQQTVANILELTLHSQHLAWEAAQRVYQVKADGFFSAFIEHPQTLLSLQQAQDPALRDAARQTLLEHLKPLYLQMQALGLERLHVHLPDSSSFLRFHHPGLFGDDLSTLRPSVAWVNAMQQPLSGFEAGRLSSGFRHLYPILGADQQPLGSVEFSVPFNSLRTELASLLPGREFELLLHAEALTHILFAEQKLLYLPKVGSGHFVIVNPHQGLTDTQPGLPRLSQQIFASLAKHQGVSRQLHLGHSQAVALPINGHIYTLALTTVHDLHQQAVGFVASYAPQPRISAAERSFWVTLGLATLLLMLLGLAGYIMLRENRTKLCERQRLQTINDTLSEGVYVMDEHGVITHINRRASELLNYTPKQLAGHTAHHLFHCHANNAYTPLSQCPIFKTVSAGQEYTAQEQFRRADGSIFSVWVRSRPIIQDGVNTGSVTSFSDISEQVQMQTALKASEARYRAVVETVQEVIFQIDEYGQWCFLNPAWARITGFDVATTLGTHFLGTLHPDERALNQRMFQDLALGEKKYCRYETRCLQQQGGVRWLEVYSQALYTPEGDFCGISGTLTDITTRKNTEQRLRLAASVFTSAHEGIMITDTEGTIVEVNETFSRITGYLRKEVLGRNPRLLKSGQHAQVYYENLWHSLRNQGHWSGELWNRRKNGELYAQLANISAVRNSQGQTEHYVTLFTDITPIKEHQKQLEHIAHFDALSGLPNRVLLADRLRTALLQAQRRGQMLALAYLDLDGFKAINDSYGHHTGDELLIVLSQRMQETLRAGDTLARLGGDEFVVVLVDLDSISDAEPVLQRLLAAVAKPVPLHGRFFTVSASIGVTAFPQDDGDADQLLRHADQAMYVAKQMGKNRYHWFDLDQDADIRIQQKTLSEIQQALESGAFVLHYQPKVNLKTGALIGAEALIRWQHPQHGLLSPASFLPLIEDCPLGARLDEWTIGQAMLQITAWQQQGLHVPISVNIGAQLLQQGEFFSRLCALFEAHPEVNPMHLELEILETSALEDMQHVANTLKRCRELGVGLALDDFGTGYSSLSYLKKLPTNVLKIDQSFVRDMLEDPDDLSIVKAVLGLASAFGHTVVAEGVESSEHARVLRALGCEFAQGYGIAKPMPADQLPIWLDAWRMEEAIRQQRERQHLQPAGPVSLF